MFSCFMQVDGDGCELEDFPASLEGQVALISRGNCTFALKALNSIRRGAVAVLIFNSQETIFRGTLGNPSDNVIISSQRTIGRG